jgi:hypothetical protein
MGIEGLLMLESGTKHEILESAGVRMVRGVVCLELIIPKI